MLHHVGYALTYGYSTIMLHAVLWTDLVSILIQEDENDPQNRKKLINLIFWSAGCSILRAEGFFCSLDVLCGGLGINKSQFLIKQDNFFLSTVNILRLQNPWSGSGFNWNAGSGSTTLAVYFPVLRFPGPLVALTNQYYDRVIMVMYRLTGTLRLWCVTIC
jgi:hypothetical protein